MYYNILHTKKKYLLIILMCVVFSCKKKFEPNDYTAYFSGEIQNPTCNFLLFYKDNTLLDTIFLDDSNKFSIKFDSLTPGMYIYKMNPEIQYVYFDKNDSLNLRLNSNDFDHSIIFSGRGAEKNNFLMNLTVKNLLDENNILESYDLSIDQFLKMIDSTLAVRTTYYLKNKAIINWSSDFDMYAKSKLDLHFFGLKEIYPIAHYARTNEDVRNQLPKDYYSFRQRIDFNNEKMIRYSSFTKYLSILLNSISNESDISFDGSSRLDKVLIKLHTVDTLIKNQSLKNTILNNVALIYLLEDQSLNNNERFFEEYFKLSSDSTQQKDVLKIQASIQNLKKEKRLPDVKLVNTEGNKVNLNSLINKKTLVFVWTKNGMSHANASHNRALELLRDNPNLQIISICIDGDHEDWVSLVDKYQHSDLIKLRSTNFNELRDKWVITKIQRSLLLNRDGTIDQAFINIFDNNLKL